MSIDSSLKIKGALSRHRNVLSRAERIEKLKEEERWSENNSVFGLAKVAHRKTHAGRKEAKEETAEQAAATATEAAAAAEVQPEATEKTGKKEAVKKAK